MKRILRGPIGLAALLGLLALLALPVYALLLMLLVLLPLVLLRVTFSDWRAGLEPRDFGGVAMRVFAALVIVPLVILAVLAPMRAVLMGTLGYFPAALAKFNEPHEALFWPFMKAFGERFPYWLDLAWGFYGAGVIFLLALFDSIRRNRLAAQIRNLPTSRVRSVAVGLAELAGRARPLPEADASQPIIHTCFERSGNGHVLRTRIDPFYLDDGTGLLRVEAAGSDVSADTSAFSIGLHQVKLRQVRDGEGPLEARLMPGDEVFVLGTVQINDDPVTRETDPLVIKPKQSAWLRLDFYDLFFLAPGGERGRLDAFAASIHRGWAGVLALMALTGWLSVQAWTHIAQLEALDLEAAPAAFRLVTPPTPLEREIAVPGLGSRPALDWLEQLRRPGEGKHAILERLHRAGLATLALPWLLDPAQDIEHPDFGPASHWLLALGAMPAGTWGYEFYGRRYEGKREPVVFRALLRREGGRLLVSYDAYFGEYVSKRITARKVELVLKDERTGLEHAAVFEAHPGWNRARNVEAFARFPRGEFRLTIRPRREYDGRLYDTGPLTMPEVRVAL